MRKHPRLPLIVLSLLIWKATPSQAGPLGQTVAEMASNCEVFRSVDVRTGKLSFKADDFRTGVCWGSFLSFFYFANLVEETQRSPLHVCPPESAKVATFIQIFIEYADQHPQYANEPFGIIAQVALMQAFPCRGDTITGSG
jgi:hypothetical protein